MMRVLILFFAALFSLSAAGQIGELKQKLEQAGDPEEQAKLHNELAWDYRDIRSDSALYHATKAYGLAADLGLEHEMVQALNYMGVAYRNLSVYSKAFEKYLEALKLAEDIGDQEQRGYALINIGNLYLFQRNFGGAVRYFIQALDQAQELGDKRMQGYCFVNLGRSYRGTEEYGQSELYYKQALEVRAELGDVYGIKAVQIDLADTYRRKGDLNQALDYSYELVEKLDPEIDGRALLFVYNNIAKIFIERGDNKKAEENALIALKLAESFSSRYDIKEVLLTLSEVYKNKKDFFRAYRRYIDYAELNQQLFSEENIRKIEQLRNQYEIQQQEAENEFLRRQDELNKEVIERQQVIIGLTGVALILLIITALVSFRAYLDRKRFSVKISKQKDEIEKDRDLIEKQSNKLKELDEAKSRFFANVSHDLRSPLSLILGNMEMIEEDEDTFLSTKAKGNFEVGFKNIKRLLYLTDEINDITKLEEGKIKLKLERVKINGYIKFLCGIFKSTASYKGVKLSFASELDDMEYASIDPRQFEKIFYNLISNALRHTHKGGEISVRILAVKDAIVMEFRDSGDGIASNSLPYIFDRFYQSKDNQFKSREGLGIGLALVKELVELHDGKITVESELGKGTTFTVTLKHVSISGLDIHEGKPGKYIESSHQLFRDLEVDEKALPNLEMQDTEKSLSILIVDDHPEIRFYIRQILEEKYNVLEAAHGLEAIDLLDNKDVSLIVTDLMMPWMDGFELIEAINQRSDLKTIPLLVVSARISDDTKEKVLYKGVNDYLQKPFQRKELLLRVENLLAQKSKFSEGEGKNVFQELVARDNISSVEQDILLKLETVVKERIGDPRLSVLQVADALAASERQVYRLVKKITGLTPHEYITEVRLQYVEFLIRNKKVKNATEAAKTVGQNNVTTFNRQFQRKYGVKPAELLND